MQNKVESHIFKKDLESPETFRSWVKKNLPNLYANNKPSNEHLLIYIDYVRGLVKSLNPELWPDWMDLIRNLKKNLESIQRVRDNEL